MMVRVNLHTRTRALPTAAKPNQVARPLEGAQSKTVTHKTLSTVQAHQLPVWSGGVL